MITLKVNGKEFRLDVQPNELLIDVLQKRLGLYGSRMSCGQGECGACTVLLDGEPTLSCMMLAYQAEGKDILTIEGLADENNLHPIQEAFVEEQGFQCGFCTPGFIMSTKGLLDSNPNPNEEEIKKALSGNICRCGSYSKVVKAVNSSAKKLEGSHGAR